MPSAAPHVRRARGHGQGFTIVELLVVVAVVATLVGILVPAVGMARRASMETGCLANMRSMTAALQGYLNLNGEHFPLSSHSTEDIARADAWVNSLVSYGFQGDARRCPADPYAESRITTYATNTFFEPLVAGIDFDPFSGQALPGGRTQARTRLSQVPHPDRTFWAVEMDGQGFVDHVHSVGWHSAAEIRAAVAVERHGDHANYAFPDGHVAPVNWNRIETDFTQGRSPFDPETP
jgi:prepilin-type processing-associated H-X9-DG protein/prepilin-type N-terminal cleavage/methylation domain-containing protein